MSVLSTPGLHMEYPKATQDERTYTQGNKLHNGKSDRVEEFSAHQGLAWKHRDTSRSERRPSLAPVEMGVDLLQLLVTQGCWYRRVFDIGLHLRWVHCWKALELNFARSLSVRIQRCRVLATHRRGGVHTGSRVADCAMHGWGLKGILQCHSLVSFADPSDSTICLVL